MLLLYGARTQLLQAGADLFETHLGHVDSQAPVFIAGGNASCMLVVSTVRDVPIQAETFCAQNSLYTNYSK